MSTDPRAATSRSKGAVGQNPIVYRVFRENFSVDDSRYQHILDFGAGKGAPHTLKLRAEGYHAKAWDLPENQGTDDGVWLREYDYHDVVLLSNVLNVQESRKQMVETLKVVKACLFQSGVVIANYPASPRKNPMTVEEVLHTLRFVLHPKLIVRVAGTPAAPCWLLYGKDADPKGF